MAKKLKHFIVSVDVTQVFEVEVDASSEENAEKAVKKSIKNGTVKPIDEVVEITDVYEPDDGDNED